jgi:branched-subunit amino acid aminotransferase/4-amino-4-deoxychorismate lyase
MSVPAPAPPVLLDGVLVPADGARVSALEPALTHGDGLFETVRVVAGRAVALGAHCARLTDSAGAIGLPSPTVEAWAALAGTLLSAAPGFPEAALRLQLGAPRYPEAPPMTLVTVRPLGPREATRRGGLDLWTIPWARAPRGGLGAHKLVSWSATPIAARTHPRGGDPTFEAVFTEGPDLLEGGTSALALLAGDQLRVPPLDGRIFASVTRARLLACAADLGLRVAVGPLTVADARAADAVLGLNALLPVSAARQFDGVPLYVSDAMKSRVDAIRRALDPA